MLAGLICLQELSLQGCRNIAGHAALEGLQQLRQLQVLGLRNCDGLTDGALEPLKALTGLVSLDLSGCQQLSGPGCVALPIALSSACFVAARC